MAPDKPPPLPLAPDRAALSNRISLLLSAQSSVLKTMSQSSGTATRHQPPRQHHHRTDEEDLFRENARPNEGVGYVADAAKAKSDEAAREDRMLRGRLLGKRKDLNDGRRGAARPAEEDEEDDEGGRSSLGKRKRPKRVAETAQEAVEVEASNQAREGNVELDQTDEGHNDLDDTRANDSREPGSSDLPDPNQSTAEAQTKKKKKKRKNKKSKNEGVS